MNLMNQQAFAKMKTQKFVRIVKLLGAGRLRNIRTYVRPRKCVRIRYVYPGVVKNRLFMLQIKNKYVYNPVQHTYVCVHYFPALFSHNYVILTMKPVW